LRRRLTESAKKKNFYARSADVQSVWTGVEEAFLAKCTGDRLLGALVDSLWHRPPDSRDRDPVFDNLHDLSSRLLTGRCVEWPGKQQTELAKCHFHFDQVLYANLPLWSGDPSGKMVPSPRATVRMLLDAVKGEEPIRDLELSALKYGVNNYGDKILTQAALPLLGEIADDSRNTNAFRPWVKDTYVRLRDRLKN